MMPMPQKPMMGPSAAAPVPPGAEGGGPGEGQNPDAIKQQLIQLLTKAKQVAEQNGVNFSDVLSEVDSNKSRSDVPLPRPPSAGPPMI